MTIVSTPRGLPVTTGSSALALALHHFEEQVLDYGQDAAALFDALPLDPDCALASAYAAALHLFRATREGHARAWPLAAAASGLSAESVRERSLVATIGRWATGDLVGAIEVLAGWVAAEPTDLFAAKLHQQLLFSRGGAGSMLCAIRPVALAAPGDARVLGMLAFALDQTGRHAEAERTARRALELAPDPWAHHALAHVMDAEGRHAEGCMWMSDHSDAWANCTSFLYTHNWWHAALFHLGVGDRDGALALYHERVWAVRKHYVQDQVNAVSLLARLEFAGVDVGDRWEEVSQYVSPRRTDAIDGFLDLHYAYALARAGDDVGVRDLLNAKAAACDGSRARDVGLAAAEGVAAFAFGDRTLAARKLAPVAADLTLLGGSTVQRRLFTDILASARGSGGHALGMAA